MTGAFGYEIYEEIGIIAETKMSKVYKSKSQWGELVAVKCYKTESQSHRFKREIETLLKYRNIHTIEILDFDHDDYRWYAMPVAKHSLKEYMDQHNGKINFKDSYNVLYGLSKGLEPLHNYRQVHRDLKPDNILYIEDNNGARWVVSDFGIIRNRPGDTTFQDTRIGSGIGTLGWAAPEQLDINKQDIDAHNVSPSADVYSCGLIAAHILAPGNLSPNEIISKVERRELMFLTQKIEDTIHTSLSHNPADRQDNSIIFFRELLPEVERVIFKGMDCDDILYNIDRHSDPKKILDEIINFIEKYGDDIHTLRNLEYILDILQDRNIYLNGNDQEFIKKFIDLLMEASFSEDWKICFSKIVNLVVHNNIWSPGAYILHIFNRDQNPNITTEKLHYIEQIIIKPENKEFFRARKSYIESTGSTIKKELPI